MRQPTRRSVRRMDSPESRRFWEQLDRNREEVAGWPEWKRQTPVADPPLPRSPFEALERFTDHHGVRSER
jgi:hypothetical protein